MDIRQAEQQQVINDRFVPGRLAYDQTDAKGQEDRYRIVSAEHAKLPKKIIAEWDQHPGTRGKGRPEKEEKSRDHGDQPLEHLYEHHLVRKLTECPEEGVPTWWMTFIPTVGDKLEVTPTPLSNIPGMEF